MTISTTQCYLFAKQSFIKQDALIHLLSNKLIFYHTLGSYIHKAGNLGCSNLRSFITILNDEPLRQYLLGEHPVEVLNYRQLRENPLVNQSTLARIDKTQPILWIKSLTQMSPIISLNTGKLDSITVRGVLKWPNGSKLMLLDCAHGIVLTLIDSKVSGDHTVLYVTPFDVKAHHFGQQAFVGLLESTFFYVGDTKRQARQGMPIYAFYRLNISGTSQELIDGVDSWEISLATQDNPTRWFNSVDDIKSAVIKIKAKVSFSLTMVPHQTLNKNNIKKPDKKSDLEHQVSSFTWYLKSWA